VTTKADLIRHMTLQQAVENQNYLWQAQWLIC